MRWKGKNSVNLRIIKALAPNTRKHWHQTLVATVCATTVGDGVATRWVTKAKGAFYRFA